MALPTAEWLAALDEMEAALAGKLDGYQAKWEGGETGVADAGPTGALGLAARLDGRLQEWDARLAAAGELAASVERQLDEREATVGRWRELFTGWRELLQRGVDPATPAVGSKPD